MSKPHYPVSFEASRRMPMLVLRTLATHAASLRACIDVVSRDAHFLASAAAPPAPELEQALRSSRESNSVHLVAVDNGQVVGWAQIDRGNGSSVAHSGDLAMGVLPEYQGLGLGKRLLSQCITEASEKGIDRIELEVRADNHRAINLYRASGFAVESIVRQAMSVDGRYHDAFRMYLVNQPMPSTLPGSRAREPEDPFPAT